RRSTRDFPSRCCRPYVVPATCCVKANDALVVRGGPSTKVHMAAHMTTHMTALGKLLRTTAFRLTLVYLTLFALFAAFVLVYFAWNTRRLITEQITQTVDAEITGLAEQYRQGGIRR